MILADDNGKSKGDFIMTIHPERRQLSDELHARPFHDFDGAGRFIRYIFLYDKSDKDIVSHINDWLTVNDRLRLGTGEKFRRETFERYIFRIERHTEFVTIGFIMKGETVRNGLSQGAFEKTAWPDLPFDVIETVPASLFHAIWVEIGGRAPAKLDPLKVQFMLSSKAEASSQISDGAGQLHCSFDIDENQFSRAIVFHEGVTPARMGRMVLRIIEMETYRMLALLGLPESRKYLSTLVQIEHKLTQLTRQLTEQISQDDTEVQALLPALSQLAAQVEEISANTSYRLSATKAYHDIFLARLEGLRLARLDGHQGVYGFLDRRMMPAMQTCFAFGERVQTLSQRIERTGSLLRTQTETTIQRQNRDLLSSMDRRAQAQLRLQQTVEGLSVIAGTYYGVGLVGILVEGLNLQPPFDKMSLVKAFAVPFVAIVIWFFINRVSRSVRRLNK
ncbi:MAG: hypothetical protein CMM80_06190 [Rhodospirillaceae bacterium]|nr:hypothetical protein [Rhodospirillaceae bacterium]